MISSVVCLSRRNSFNSIQLNTTRLKAVIASRTFASTMTNATKSHAGTHTRSLIAVNFHVNKQNSSLVIFQRNSMSYVRPHWATQKWFNWIKSKSLHSLWMISKVVAFFFSLPNRPLGICTRTHTFRSFFYYHALNWKNRTFDWIILCTESIFWKNQIFLLNC